MQNISISGAQMNVYIAERWVQQNNNNNQKHRSHRMETAEKDIEIEERKKIEKGSIEWGNILNCVKRSWAAHVFKLYTVFLYSYAYAATWNDACVRASLCLFVWVCVREDLNS